MRRFTAIGLVLAAAAMAGVVCLLAYWSGQSRYQSGLVEELHGMPPESAEESRRYLKVDGVVRRTEITFKDGCLARKLFGGTTADGKPILTEAIEIRPDGSQVVYKFEADGTTPHSRTQYRKDQTRYCESIKEADQYVHHFYYEDGNSLLAVFRPNPLGYEFTAYNSKGGKLYDEVCWKEIPPPKPEGQSGDQEPSGTMTKTYFTFTVFNGNANPLYRQHWFNENYSEAGEGEYEGSNPSLQKLEELHEGTALPQRQLVFDVYTQIGDTSLNTTVVTIFGENGKEKFVRYLDSDRRIRRMVDKTVQPELTRDIKEDEAVKEELDETRLAPLDDEQSMRLKQEALAGGDHSHLDRILLP
jgi:hypothetical protein